MPYVGVKRHTGSPMIRSEKCAITRNVPATGARFVPAARLDG
jgi:hypothetical protein